MRCGRRSAASVDDVDGCADRNQVVDLLHGEVVESDAAARPVLRLIIGQRGAMPVNVDLAAELGMLRRHRRAGGSPREFPRVPLRDQPGREAAPGIFRVGVADAQGQEKFAARILRAYIELAERRRLVALDRLVDGPVPAQRDRIGVFEEVVRYRRSARARFCTMILKVCRSEITDFRALMPGFEFGDDLRQRQMLRLEQ